MRANSEPRLTIHTLKYRPKFRKAEGIPSLFFQKKGFLTCTWRKAGLKYSEVEESGV